MAKPTAKLSQTKIEALLGSIIQLDGRDSSDPDGIALIFSWKLKQKPIGSQLVLNADTSLKDLRPPTKSAVSFIPDVVGTYVVELMVSNGTLSSDALSASTHIGLSKVPVGQGIVPDSSLLWEAISDFWRLVEDRSIFETIWSSTIQVMGADLVRLWAHDYDKALSTIQSRVQHRWQRYTTRTSLAGAAQSLIVGQTRKGVRGRSGPLMGALGTKTRVFHVPYATGEDPDLDGIDINYGAGGRIIQIGADAFTIERVFDTVDDPVAFDALLTYNGTTFTDIGAGGRSVTDNKPIFALTAGAGDYVYLGLRSKSTNLQLALSQLASADIGLTVEYSTTTGWSTLTLVSNTLAGLTVEKGALTWASPGDWAQRTENGSLLFWIRLRRTNLAAITEPIESSISTLITSAVVVLDEEQLTSGQQGLSWRVPHLLHTPTLDLKKAGVRAGDVLVLEFVRRDTGISAELRAQVVGVDRYRLGFEFSLEDLAAGGTDFDHAPFRQLAQDLRLVLPSASSTEIAATAEALIAFLPPGINLAARPFTPYQIVVRAKEVIRNSALVVPSAVQSIPYLQREIATPSVVWEENRHFTLASGLVSFQPGTFTLKAPSPDEFWAEVVFVDNSQTIEDHFGRAVGLPKDALELKDTRPPYLAAVRGLWFAATGGPTISNLRLGAQILLGLPFTDERGVVLDIQAKFSKDAQGNDLGRILVEDVDEDGRRLGVRHVYLYPTEVGLEVNPATGKTIAVDDRVDRFIPLSKGIEVDDYVKTPDWWSRSLHGLEVLKLFTFKVALDAAANVFSLNDFRFMIRFVNVLKPTYTRLIASVIRQLLDDAGPVDNWGREGTRSQKLTYNFYDNVLGIEATQRADDHNRQGAPLLRAGSHPFSTRTVRQLADIQTLNVGGVIKATSAGFGLCRARIPFISAQMPAREGDLLVILPRQAGAGLIDPGIYEITALDLGTGTATLGHVPPLVDPLVFDLLPPSASTFPLGSGLRGCVLRRELGSVIQGSDLEVDPVGLGIHARSLTSDLLANGVRLDDHLIIESGPNEGEYRIDAIDQANDGTAGLTRPVSHFSATICALKKLDGVLPTFTAQTGQLFRVVRPPMIRLRPQRVGVTSSGADRFVESYETGIDPLKPLDTFTPGMVDGVLNQGAAITLFDTVNPANNGTWPILDYVHPGKVKINHPSAVATGGPVVGIIRSLWHPGYENILELSPFEAVKASVS